LTLHRLTLRSLGTALLCIALLLLTDVLHAAEATLAWDPNHEADLAGYGVYFKQGIDGPPYEFFGFFALSDMTDPNSPVFEVTGLQQNATYYFAVTAYDTSDNESAYSTSVCAQVGAIVTACADTGTGTPPPSSGSAPASGGSSGGGGGGCFITSLHK